jgi:hypothetical protein
MILKGFSMVLHLKTQSKQLVAHGVFTVVTVPVHYMRLQMLGLTRERVRQIEAKALAKIRKRLQEQGITARNLL